MLGVCWVPKLCDSTWHLFADTDRVEWFRKVKRISASPIPCNFPD